MTAPNATGKGRHNIAGLADLSRNELVLLWNEELDAKVPNGMSRPMVLRILAWELQARECGGLSPSLRRELNRVLDGASGNDTVRKAKPGARLVREWNGEAHIVEVFEGGFTWNGRAYKSLSAIARDITGTRWSGPRFFGLAGKSS